MRITLHAVKSFWSSVCLAGVIFFVGSPVSAANDFTMSLEGGVETALVGLGNEAQGAIGGSVASALKVSPRYGFAVGVRVFDIGASDSFSQMYVDTYLTSRSNERLGLRFGACSIGGRAATSTGFLARISFDKVYLGVDASLLFLSEEGDVEVDKIVALSLGLNL